MRTILLGLLAQAMIVIAVGCGGSANTVHKASTAPPDLEATVATIGEDVILENLFWSMAVNAGSTRDSTFEQARTAIVDALDADLKSRVAELGARGMADPFRDWPHCYVLGTSMQSIILLGAATTPLEAAPQIGLALDSLPDLTELSVTERGSPRCDEIKAQLTGR